MCWFLMIYHLIWHELIRNYIQHLTPRKCGEGLNKSAQWHNALLPPRNQAMPLGMFASSNTDVQGSVPAGSTSALLPWWHQRLQNVRGQKWGACRGEGATKVAKPIHLWCRRWEKKQWEEDRWTGSVQRGQKRRFSRSSTFSLRFFAKWAEQKAEVRFLSFQCDEDRKWQYLNSDQI